MKTILFLCLNIICFTAFAATPNITQDSFLANDANESLILDVRSKEEFDQGHVPGAINIPHTEIVDHLEQLLPYQDKTIVLYCRSGRRAEMAANTLTELHFNHLLHLEGDMQGWVANERSIEK